MADIGISRLDQLYDGMAGAAPITAADSGEIVGVVQELLRNHGLRKVPGAKHVTGTAVPSDPAAEPFGAFGKYTKRAVGFFQDKHGLSKQNPPVVDAVTLRRLIQASPGTVCVGRAYLTRRLEIADAVICRVLTLISSWEEHAATGGFCNWKPQDAADKPQTGLSFGILQWTHGSARLGTLLEDFEQNAALFSSCFGYSGQDATAMVNHAKGGEAVLKANGDPVSTSMDKFNFQKRVPWKAKFVTAGSSTAYQVKQVERALADLRAIHTSKKAVWTKITSQRGWGFMLDFANQFGEGGANTKYTNAVTALPAGSEDYILQHIESANPATHQPRRHYFRVDSPLPNNVAFPTNP
ncbi:MAG: peptidoglycan-binding protein [Planctomycetes bacterium]|nr:peptidoglycan-binding protein [Planctomycetota bacterium]